MDNQFIPKGMEIVKQAVIADNNDELETALALYRQGLQYFLTGLKYVKNDTAKAAIREKMNTYMTRAEQIKEGQTPQTSAHTAAEGGGAGQANRGIEH